MLDCWKNSCHGATVVPTIAMISSTEVDVTPPSIPGTKKSCATCPPSGMGEKEQRHDEQVREHEHEHRSLPRPEAAGGCHRHERDGCDRNRHVIGNAEVAEREAHPDELGDDGQEVQYEQVDHREPAPEAAEPLDDQTSVTDAGDGAEANDHLLVDDQHRNQQKQHPQQAGAVVLAGLRVGGDPAGVVVADHHDQPRADDCQQRQAARAPAPVRFLVLADRPECALDVADVRRVEHEPLAAPGAGSDDGGAGDGGVEGGGEAPEVGAPGPDRVVGSGSICSTSFLRRCSASRRGREVAQFRRIRSSEQQRRPRRRPRACYFAVCRRCPGTRCRPS